MQSILITGANRGIGLELTRSFCDGGWKVHACCRNPDRADELLQLKQAQPHLAIRRLDVTDGSLIAALAAELREEPIDILLNNAGIKGPSSQEFGAIDEEGWLETFRVNTIAPLRIAESLVENVARSERRIIAAMGSAMGSIAENASGRRYAYRTSKAAVHMVMKGLAVDLRDRGITAVVLHPGWVRTGLGGDEAPVTPAESARGIKKVLDGLTIADSGSFFDYQGQRRSW